LAVIVLVSSMMAVMARSSRSAIKVRNIPYYVKLSYPPLACTLAQLSRKPTVRVNTSRPGAASRSRQKYPCRSNGRS
jgi:hypothetical protein